MRRTTHYAILICGIGFLATHGGWVLSAMPEPCAHERPPRPLPPPPPRAYDTPPRLISFEAPKYPELSRAAGIQGDVRVLVLVGENGSVSKAVVVSSNVTPAMERAAIESAKRSCFEPARLDRDPVEAKVLIPFHFRLEEPSPPPETADTSQSLSTPLPGGLVLHQNVPNPFNPATTIRLDLPKSARVTLDIFTVDGSLVTTLIDRQLPPGIHRFVWTGLNGRGKPVSSGVYFYRLKAGSSTGTKKMLLLR